jgi:hypothetical protein
MFINGQRLKCIGRIGSEENLTIGKIYKNIGMSSEFVTIKDDKGKINTFSKSRFSVVEYPKSKLKIEYPKSNDKKVPNHSDHYNKDVQPIDLYMAKGELTGYARSSILRYAFRFGDKKGQEQKDIKKIIDCALLMGFSEGYTFDEAELVELIKTRLNWIKSKER